MKSPSVFLNSVNASDGTKISEMMESTQNTTFLHGFLQPVSCTRNQNEVSETLDSTKESSLLQGFLQYLARSNKYDEIPEMFECTPDICLLRSCLLSVSRSLKCDEECKDSCNHPDVNDAAKVVSRTIKNIIVCNLNNLKDEMEILKAQLFVNRKLHAAVFYSSLVSCGITSASADDFYSCIAFTYSTLDWKFYLLLNYKCNWSEHFIECAKQLPCEIIDVISKKMLDIQLEKDIKYYLWHMILNVIIHKYCFIEKKLTFEIYWPFDYMFECPEAVSDSPDLPSVTYMSDVNDLNDNTSKNNDIKLLMNLYNIIYEYLCFEKEQEIDNVNFVNFLLHSTKTLFMQLNHMRIVDILSVISEFSGFLIFLKQSLALESCQALLAKTMKCNINLFDYLFLTTSWGISISYLTFVLFYCWKELKEKLCGLNTIEDNFCAINGSVCCVIKSEETIEILKKFNPVLTDNFEQCSNVEECLSLLTGIIKCRYPYAARVVEIFLSHPVLLERDEIVIAVEKNLCLLDIGTAPVLLADAVVKVKSDKSRIKILKVLYKILSQGPLNMYNDILSHILIAHGHTEKFKLPEFDIELVQFLRKALSLQEAEAVLPRLFLQSPKRVLMCVIDQALKQGYDGKALIQTLKHVPIACYYHTTKIVSPLIEGLRYYFDSDELEPFVMKNMVAVIQLLMQVQCEREILPVDSFLTEFIMHNLHHSENEKKSLILECLNVTLSVLLKKSSLHISAEVMKRLVHDLCELTDNCIQSGNGNLKELVSNALSYLTNYQEKNGKIDDEAKCSLLSALSSFDPQVILYATTFIPHKFEVSDLPLSHLFLWCCIKKNTTAFEERIKTAVPSYTGFLNILTKLQFHFTKEEWFHSSCLVEIYCKYYSLNENEMSSYNVSWRFPQNTSYCYAVVRCFLESFHFLLQENIGDILFISSCFSKTLMNIVKQEKVEPQFLLNVFLDLCFTLSHLELKQVELFTPILMDLTKKITSDCIEESSTQTYMKILSHAVIHLPVSSEKDSLLSKVTESK